MSDENLKWERVKTEHIVKDEWIDFRRVAYKLPDGNVFSPFYNYSRRNYVIVVASDEQGKFLCVKQFRHGIEKVTTEFPAGGIERSGKQEYADSEEDKTSAEDALVAAKRELIEETGYESDEWQHLITIASNATMADNYAYVYRAKNCRKISGQHLDDTEFLGVEKHSAEEIEEMIRTGNFEQAVHVMAWLLAARG
ncbi:MAG: NUDIX hydrolase [Lachnospiraceae bacterium]|nr:NUDIX hydrolase [Lachnospiraceae bacterium]MBQ5376353.1 NUDIX hydrolase [Lachnospiraceae bacterium]